MATRSGRVLRAVLSLVLTFALTTGSVSYAAPPEKTPPERVELTDMRDPYSKTFDNGDGTWTLESHLEPVHYLDEASGGFEEIKTALVETAEDSTVQGRTNAANAFSLFLPDRLGETPTTIENALGSVSMRPLARKGRAEGLSTVLSTAAPVASRDDAVAYAGVFSGATLEYRSVPQGLKETIVLSAPVKDPTFSFEVICPGLTPSLDSTGSVTFTSDTTEETAFVVVPPFMEDSRADEDGGSAHSDAVHYELMRLEGSWRLDVVADTTWLSDPERVWPVRIDPTTYDPYTTGRWAECADAFVSSASPTSNYGNVTELRTGNLNSTTGVTRTYVKPHLGDLIGKSLSVLDAKLNLYCFDRPDSNARAMKVSMVDSSWSETGITWNNKPGATDLGKNTNAQTGTWSTFDVTGHVREVLLGTRSYYGYMISAVSEVTSPTFYSRFYSLENADTRFPYLTVKYTSEPKVSLEAPGPMVPVAPVGSSPKTIVARWTYDDWMGKTQSKAQVQVSKTPDVSTLVRDSGLIAWTTPSMVISADDNWVQSRYWIRMRVCGNTPELPGTEATSNWTEWQPFDIKPLTSSNRGEDGLRPYQAKDPVGAGLEVDLSTGRLVGSRTDVSVPGIGGALTYGATYDSGRTADEGLGRGWKLGSPKYAPGANIAKNPGFEEVSGGNPAQWAIDMEDDQFVNSTTADKYSGSRSVCFALTSQVIWGNVWIATASSSNDALRVNPGERLSARAMVKTVSMTVDKTQAEHGPMMKIHYYDAYGNPLPSSYSALTPSYRTGTSGTWFPMTLHDRVPAGAWYAKLNLEMRNARGVIYFDDVEFSDQDFTFTDASGVIRDLEAVGEGIYSRDPLDPGVAFTEVNVARGAKVTSSSGVAQDKSTDGVFEGYNGSDGFDWCTYDPSGYLQYDLGSTQVLSRVRMLLWDGVEDTARAYTYKIEVSADGQSWSPAVAQTTGRSWVDHSFSARRARYIRVTALGNTAAGNNGFHVVELEAPQLRLGDTPVAFDANGRIEATGDLSGNMVGYSFDGYGQLNSCIDQGQYGWSGRWVQLTWTGGKLTGALNRGVDSAGTTTNEPGYVTYSEVPYGTGTEYSIKRRDGAAEVAVLKYRYDSAGRIIGAYDADGGGFSLAYDTLGRVKTVTQAGTSPAITTTYTYDSPAAGTVRIATTGGATSAPERQVTIDASLGGQVTKVKTVNTAGASPETTITYDEYGQAWKVKDPLGQVSRIETDGRGNVLVAAEENATGVTQKASTARYDRDHVVRTTDEAGNESKYSYDASWRLLSAAQTVSESAADGSVVSRSSYDDWGNLTSQAVSASTAQNLVRNGTFALNPLIAGNGWDGARAGGPDRSPTSQKYLGGQLLILGNSQTPPYITSDAMAVKTDLTYTLSAWVSDWGRIQILEYNASGTQIGTIDALQCASRPGELRRTSVTYRPSSSNVASVRLRPSRPIDGSFSVDNIRFEAATSASLDSFLENASMEQLSAGVPRAWAKRGSGTGGTNAVHGASTDEQVSGIRSASIKDPTSAEGWLYSDPVPVTPGETYTAGIHVKTKSSTGGARVYMRFYNSSGSQVSSDAAVAGLAKGTTEWTSHISQFTVPAGAATVRMVLQHEKGSGEAFFDAALLCPQTGIATIGYDNGTHTYPVVTTAATGVKASSTYDSRGRVTATSVTPSDSSTAIQASAATYDGLDRLKSATIAPGLGANKSTATYSYTPAGRLSSVTDPRGNVSTPSYDSAGRLTGGVSATGINTKLEYDALGRLSKTYEPRQGLTPTEVSTEVGYDALSRTSSVTYKSPGGSTYATRALQYDVGSRVTAETLSGSVSASAQNTYDILDRLTARTTQGPAGTVSQTIAYNTSDLPTSIGHTALGASWTEANTWAKTKELVRKTVSGTSFDFSFASSGSLTSMKSPHAMQTRSYDPHGRLDTVRDGFSYSANGDYSNLLEATLVYDTLDRARSQQVTDGYLSANSFTDSFGYDDADRLTSWTRTGAGAVSATYTHDPAGNLAKVVSSGVTTEFTSDADNRLTRMQTGGAVTDYQNDTYGRRVRKETATDVTTYRYDALGQLDRVIDSSAGSAFFYSYGISGMREMKERGSSSWTKSVWDGQQLLSELDSDGTRYTYVWGPGRVPLALKVKPSSGAEKTYSYHIDAMGNVVALMGPDGMEAARYRYDPWGKVTYTGGTDLTLANRNPLRYRAYYYDIETGHYYLPARYYDPETTRFLSPDPAQAEAGNPLTLNRYAYCVGDPVNHFDPSGAVLVEFVRADEQRKLGGGDLAKGRAKVALSRVNYRGMGGLAHWSKAQKAQYLKQHAKASPSAAKVIGEAQKAEREKASATSLSGRQVDESTYTGRSTSDADRAAALGAGIGAVAVQIGTVARVLTITSAATGVGFPVATAFAVVGAVALAVSVAAEAYAIAETRRAGGTYMDCLSVLSLRLYVANEVTK